MNGNNIIVYTYSGSAWTAIASVKSDELQHECDLIEKASATQQNSKEFIAGRKQWSLNVNWLMTTVSDLEKVLLVGVNYDAEGKESKNHTCVIEEWNK